VIDKTEAEKIFGPNTIKSNTEEYLLGNAIYGELLKVENITDILGYYFYLIGSLDSKPQLLKRKR
jgi:hypothetical protein